MIPMRPASGRFALSFLFAHLLIAPFSRAAETPEGSETTTPSLPQADEAGEASERALGLELELSDTPLDAARIQAALESELGVQVRAASEGERLRLRIQGSELDATFGDPEGRSVSRHVELPQDESQQLELIALLSGNLVRDEAHALLERLRRGSEKDAQASKAVAPVAPPPSPVPDKRPKAQARAKEIHRAEMPASLTLFSPASTDPKLRDHEAHFDVSVAYSDIGRLNGMAVGAGVVHVADGGRGFQVAGIGSATGPFEGMNVSGIYNLDAGVRGFSVAGIYLRHQAPSRGLSVSLVNVQSGTPSRADAEPDLTSRGAMIGLVNIGAHLRGAQIGLVNVQTGTMRGAQIGLVNVSKNLHGGAVGLVNVGPGVRAQALAWASMSPELDNPARQVGPMAHVGVKYRIQRFYSLLGFGVAAEANGCGTDPGCPSSDVLFAPALGAGYSFPLARSFSLEIDGLYQFEFSPRGASNPHGTVAGRLSAVWAVTPQFAFFAGGGPRVVIPNHDDEFVYYGPTFHAGIELF